MDDLSWQVTAFIAGQALVVVLAILSAAVWISRNIATLSSELASAKAAAQTGFEGVRTEVTRVETGLNKIDERHEQLRLQVNGISRTVAGHAAQHHYTANELSRLARAAGEN